MLLHGKRAALSHFFRHFKLHSTSKNSASSIKPLITSSLLSNHQLPKCLAYLRKLFPRRKINERFVRFFHGELSLIFTIKKIIFLTAHEAQTREKNPVYTLKLQ